MLQSINKLATLLDGAGYQNFEREFFISFMVRKVGHKMHQYNKTGLGVFSLIFWLGKCKMCFVKSLQLFLNHSHL